MNRPTRLVFLDVDGVINNPGCYSRGSGNRVPADPRCIAALNHITVTTGAGIVVSSTWRLQGLMFVKERLVEWGAIAPVIGRTPRLDQDLGVCPRDSRGREIAKWLEDYPGQVDSFVILDDDSDMGDLSNRLVQTNGAIGLTMQDAQRAIEVLTGAQ